MCVERDAYTYTPNSKRTADNYSSRGGGLRVFQARIAARASPVPLAPNQMCFSCRSRFECINTHVLAHARRHCGHHFDLGR